MIVYPEFMRINCVQQASISTWVSLSTFARWQHSYVLLLSYLLESDTAPSGLYAKLCHAFLVLTLLLKMSDFSVTYAVSIRNTPCLKKRQQ